MDLQQQFGEPASGFREKRLAFRNAPSAVPQGNGEKDKEQVEKDTVEKLDGVKLDLQRTLRSRGTQLINDMDAIIKNPSTDSYLEKAKTFKRRLGVSVKKIDPGELLDNKTMEEIALVIRQAEQIKDNNNMMREAAQFLEFAKKYNRGKTPPPGGIYFPAGMIQDMENSLRAEKLGEASGMEERPLLMNTRMLEFLKSDWRGNLEKIGKAVSDAEKEFNGVVETGKLEVKDPKTGGQKTIVVKNIVNATYVVNDTLTALTKQGYVLMNDFKAGKDPTETIRNYNDKYASRDKILAAMTARQQDWEDRFEIARKAKEREEMLAGNAQNILSTVANFNKEARIPGIVIPTRATEIAYAYLYKKESYRIDRDTGKSPLDLQKDAFEKYLTEEKGLQKIQDLTGILLRGSRMINKPKKEKEALEDKLRVAKKGKKELNEAIKVKDAEIRGNSADQAQLSELGNDLITALLSGKEFDNKLKAVTELVNRMEADRAA